MTVDAALLEGWYVSRDGEMDGPLASAEMRSAIGRGRVKPGDRVWREGMEAWVEAREIPNYDELRREGAELARKQKPMPRPGRIETPWGAREGTSGPTIDLPKQGRGKRERGAARLPRSQPRPEPARRAEPPPRFEPTDAGQSGHSGKGSLHDLEANLKWAQEAIQKVPRAAIAFFVFGLVMTPLLPVFWFIAWRIWDKSRRRT